jgi:ribonuclease HI
VFTGLGLGPGALTKAEAAKAHVKSLEDLHNPFSSAVTYYTDGSMGASPVRGRETTACSMCRIGPDRQITVASSWNLGFGATVADAETFAVWKALQHAYRSKPNPRHIQQIHIFIDSAAAIQRLQQPGNPTVQLAKQVAEQLTAAGITLFITWCPGH